MSDKKETGNGKSPVEANPDETTGQPVDEATDPLEALVAERDRLASHAAELQEQVLRVRADYDNFRKRAERDRADVFEYAGMETVRVLLPILDDFERALKAVPTDDGAVKEYAKGAELIYQRLMDALVKLGLEPIDATDAVFDPNLHHAVQREQRDDCEDQTVLEQYQRGYNFKGKLLRAAMVKVAVKP